MTLEDLTNQRLLILGFGKEGQALFTFFKKLWPSKEVLVSDQLDLERLSTEAKQLLTRSAAKHLFFGKNYLDALNNCDVVFKSPGISLLEPKLSEALNKGKIKLDSVAGLFFANTKGKIIGVTGTKGKSTTAALTHHILKCAGTDAHLVGNIGNTPLELLEQDNLDSIYVYELSSFQLEMLEQSPHIAIVLNVAQEHLDHHGSYEKYVHAKSHITRFQRGADLVVFNTESEVTRSIASLSPGKRIEYRLNDLSETHSEVLGFVKNNIVSLRTSQGTRELADVRDTSLLGKFNLQNILPAVLVADHLGISGSDIEEGVRSFTPLPHRLELIAERNGIRFINASLATEPEATIAHLSTLSPDVDTLIVGGTDRGVNYSQLGKTIAESNLRHLILFPTTGGKIWAEVKQYLPKTEIKAVAAKSMEEAVRLSYQLTSPGKICLLSPASASFTLFRDYRQRGELFRKYVEELGLNYSESL